MKINNEGLQLIKDSEGLRLNTYLDAVNIPTIGYGSTGSDIKMGMSWTQEQCEERLRKDVEKFEKAVQQYVNIPITENQFSALVCFTYNVGPGNFQKSTLVKLLNLGKIREAAEEFIKWNKAGGKVLNGLTSRRLKEKDLFLKPENKTTDQLPDGPSEEEINKKLKEIEEDLKKEIN